MAEFVQKHLESMLPELEEMERIELFTNKETKQILKRRRKLEYRLRRLRKEKEDYVNYIQYEMNLLKLIHKRRKKIGHKEKMREIEWSIANRIHAMFRTVCTRFYDDLKLWMSHLNFCKFRKQVMYTSKVYALMLQAHNKKPELWISAAKYELEDNSSMENARPLLQRGLRFNPQSQFLWREYFRMELLYAEKMRNRREVLGVTSLKKGKRGVSDAVLEGAVAFAVFQQACLVFPDDVEFALSFLSVCRQFDFTEQLSFDVMEDIRSLHGRCAQVRAAEAHEILQQIPKVRCRTDLHKKQISKKCVQLEEVCYEHFEEALQAVPTAEMFGLYIDTLLMKLKKFSKKHTKRRMERVLSVFHRAAQATALSEKHALLWLDTIEKSPQTDTLHEAVTLCVKLHPSCTRLWQRFLEHKVMVQDSSEAVMISFQQAVKSVPQEECLPLYRFVYEWLQLCCPDQMHAFLEKGAMSTCAEVSRTAKNWCLEWRALTQGTGAARDTYTRLKNSRPISLEFFEKYMEILKSQPKPKIAELRTVYEDAIVDFGSTSVELWLSYLDLERGVLGQCDVTNSATLHRRAVRMLRPDLVDRFVSTHVLRQTRETTTLCG